MLDVFWYKCQMYCGALYKTMVIIRDLLTIVEVVCGADTLNTSQA